MASALPPRMAVLLPATALVWLVAAGPCRRAPAAIGAATPAAAPAAGREFFVRPDGRPDGDGSAARPWDLATALGHPASVAPGDTIWLRGGLYAGSFQSRLAGEPGAPILLRAFPGERVTLDGGTSERPVLQVEAGWTWYRGLEITSSSLTRTSREPGPFPTDLASPDGVIVSPNRAPGLRFIQMIVHDTRQGFALFDNAPDAEITGCLVYFNGWDAPSGGHGHGIYVQNREGFKRISHNVVAWNFSHGLHAYAQDGYLDNIAVTGNVFVLNGTPSRLPGGRNLLLGGDRVASNPVVSSNLLYHLAPVDRPASSLDLGYVAGCSNPVVEDNYVADNTYFVGCSDGRIQGNFFFGSVQGLSAERQAGNVLTTQRPTGVRTFLGPRSDETGQALLTIYNWDLRPSVAVDAGAVLAPGDGYRIRNALDYFGEPVLEGTFEGSAVEVPMAGLRTATPVGWTAPPATGPEFNVFVLEVVGAGPAAREPARPRSATPRPVAPRGR